MTNKSITTDKQTQIKTNITNKTTTNNGYKQQQNKTKITNKRKTRAKKESNITKHYT
jgi:hypothetical protein